MAYAGRPERAPGGVLRRLDDAARAAFPASLAALLLVLAATPVGLPALGPGLALASVFFWTVFRPAAMPAPVVFALGLLQDLLGFAPPGSGVLVLLVAHGAALRARRWVARWSFAFAWLAFLAFAAGAAALGHALQALLGWRLPPLAPALVQAGLAAGAYPAVAYLLTRAHRSMERAEAAA